MAEPQQQEHQFKELEKFQMYTNAPGAEGRRSRLGFSSYRGNPRITVFTGVQNDSGKGVINAAMNPETFLIFLNLLERVAKADKEDKFKVDCDTLLKSNDGQRSQERTLASSIIAGKDAEGVMWISVVAENRPKIKFEFTVSDFHRLYHGNGQQFSKAESSVLQTLATIDALRAIFTTHASELRPPYNPDANGKGQGRGGYGNKASKPAAAAETFDDLTF